MNNKSDYKSLYSRRSDYKSDRTGGTLIVDGGTIQDANLTLVPGYALILRNGGIIRMASGKTFEAPVGAIVSVESGEIN